MMSSEPEASVADFAGSLYAREVFHIDLFNLHSRYQFLQPNSPVLTVELATEGQIKVFKCELVAVRVDT